MGEAPQIDTETAMAYRRESKKIFSTGTNAEKKQVLKSWVDHIKLTPETLEVEINYRVPEFVVNRLGAGTLSVNLHQSYLLHGWLDVIDSRRMGDISQHLCHIYNMAKT